MSRGMVNNAGGERVSFFFFYVVSEIPRSEGAARGGVSIIDDGESIPSVF